MIFAASGATLNRNRTRLTGRSEASASDPQEEAFGPSLVRSDGLPGACSERRAPLGALEGARVQSRRRLGSGVDAQTADLRSALGVVALPLRLGNALGSNGSEAVAQKELCDAFRGRAGE